MNKLTDKQMNLAILGVGVLIAIIFFTLRYFDQEEIVRLNTQKVGIDAQVAQLKNKEKQIEAKKADLFLMRENTDAIKRLLPEEKKVTEFFELVEKFRVDNNVEAFNKFKKVDAFYELNKDEEENANQPQVPVIRRPIAAPSAANPFVEDAYLIEFRGTFNQVGELISRIESYERLFSVKELDLDFGKGSIDVEELGKDVTGDIKFLLTTFTFQNPDPSVDEKVEKILKGYEDKASDELLKKVKLRREKLLKRYKYTWRNLELDENPFYSFRIPEIILENIGPIVDTGKGTVEDSAIESIEERYGKVTLLYNDKLKSKAFDSDWSGLKDLIEKNSIEEQLAQLKIENFSEEFDPSGKKREKLESIEKDVKEWKKYIAEYIANLQIQEFIEKAITKIKPLPKMFKEAKKSNGGIKAYQPIVDIYDELSPDLKNYRNREKDYPELQKARKKLEHYKRKAFIQIELAKSAKKFKLFGTIYQGKNKANVAFINGKAVRVNSKLSSGFVVKEINNNWVMLNYKGEDVPLRTDKK